MSRIKPFTTEEGRHTKELQDEGFYNLDRRSEYLIAELWEYVRYLENRVHELEMNVVRVWERET